MPDFFAFFAIRDATRYQKSKSSGGNLTSQQSIKKNALGCTGTIENTASLKIGVILTARFHFLTKIIVLYWKKHLTVKIMFEKAMGAQNHQERPLEIDAEKILTELNQKGDIFSILEKRDNPEFAPILKAKADEMKIEFMDELAGLSEEFIEILALLRMHDAKTFSHSRGVAHELLEGMERIRFQDGDLLRDKISKELGNADVMQFMKAAAFMHDVGKIAISVEILNNTVRRDQWDKIFDAAPLELQKKWLTNWGARTRRIMGSADLESPLEFKKQNNIRGIDIVPFIAAENIEKHFSATEETIKKSWLEQWCRSKNRELPAIENSRGFMEENKLSSLDIVPIEPAMIETETGSIKDLPLAAIIEQHAALSGKIIRKVHGGEQIAILAESHHRGSHLYPLSATSLNAAGLMADLVKVADIEAAILGLGEEKRAYIGNKSFDERVAIMLSEYTREVDQKNDLDKNLTALWLEMLLQKYSLQLSGKTIDNMKDWINAHLES